MVYFVPKPTPQIFHAVTPNPLRLQFSRTHGAFQSAHQNGVPVTITSVKGPVNYPALVFQTPLHEDLDGAPDSYAPPIAFNNLHPMNNVQVSETSLKNATNESDPNPVFHQNGVGNTFVWTGVVGMTAPQANQEGRAIDNRSFLADSNGRFPVMARQGTYYAPQTAATDSNGDAVNPHNVPYAVLSAALARNGHVGLGDFGIAIRPGTGTWSGFVYGDAAGRTSNSVGEASRRLIRNLFGGNATSESIIYLVFPRSSPSGRVVRPELTAPSLQQAFRQYGLFSNVDELLTLMATGRTPSPATAGLNLFGLVPVLRRIEAMTEATLRTALEAAGLPPP